MKLPKQILLCGTFVMFCVPAYAVTKCVKLTSSTTCTSFSGAVGQSNWSATCGGIEIQGVAFCGSQDGGSAGTKSENVTTSTTSDDNYYCWCKMVSPAVSSWVFNLSGTSAGDCADYCAPSCASRAQAYSALRSALFSGLSD